MDGQLVRAGGATESNALQSYLRENWWLKRASARADVALAVQLVVAKLQAWQASGLVEEGNAEQRAREARNGAPRV